MLPSVGAGKNKNGDNYTRPLLSIASVDSATGEINCDKEDTGRSRHNTNTTATVSISSTDTGIDRQVGETPQSSAQPCPRISSCYCAPSQGETSTTVSTQSSSSSKLRNDPPQNTKMSYPILTKVPSPHREYRGVSAHSTPLKTAENYPLSEATTSASSINGGTTTSPSGCIIWRGLPSLIKTNTETLPDSGGIRTEGETEEKRGKVLVGPLNSRAFAPVPLQKLPLTTAPLPSSPSLFPSTNSHTNSASLSPSPLHTCTHSQGQEQRHKLVFGATPVSSTFMSNCGGSGDRAVESVSESHANNMDEGEDGKGKPGREGPGRQERGGQGGKNWSHIVDDRDSRGGATFTLGWSRLPLQPRALPIHAGDYGRHHNICTLSPNTFPAVMTTGPIKSSQHQHQQQMRRRPQLGEYTAQGRYKSDESTLCNVNGSTTTMMMSLSNSFSPSSSPISSSSSLPPPPPPPPPPPSPPPPPAPSTSPPPPLNKTKASAQDTGRRQSVVAGRRGGGRVFAGTSLPLFSSPPPQQQNQRQKHKQQGNVTTSDSSSSSSSSSSSFSSSSSPSPSPSSPSPLSLSPSPNSEGRRAIGARRHRDPTTIPPNFSALWGWGTPWFKPQQRNTKAGVYGNDVGGLAGDRAMAADDEERPPPSPSLIGRRARSPVARREGMRQRGVPAAKTQVPVAKSAVRPQPLSMRPGHGQLATKGLHCNVCGESCSKLSNWRRHMARRHADEWLRMAQFVCPGCKARFTNATSLERHYKAMGPMHVPHGSAAGSALVTSTGPQTHSAKTKKHKK